MAFLPQRREHRTRPTRKRLFGPRSVSSRRVSLQFCSPGTLEYRISAAQKKGASLFDGEEALQKTALREKLATDKAAAQNCDEKVLVPFFSLAPQRGWQAVQSFSSLSLENPKHSSTKVFSSKNYPRDTDPRIELSPEKYRMMTSIYQTTSKSDYASSLPEQHCDLHNFKRKNIRTPRGRRRGEIQDLYEKNVQWSNMSNSYGNKPADFKRDVGLP